MRLTLPLVIACMAAGVAARAAEPVIVRQGDWWVGTVKGSEQVPASGALRVEGRGGVTLTGGAGERVYWECQARVKARDMAAARAQFQSLAVKAAQRARELYLSFTPGALDGSLRIMAPHTLRDVHVGLVRGRVEVYGLDGAVAVMTGGGEVKADRIGGDLVARTGGGEITLGEVGGSVRGATGMGPIRVRVIRGEATLDSGGGDIDAGDIGGTARINTCGGAVRLARAGAGVIVTSGGGLIDVGEARGLVEIRNSGGPVRVGAAPGVRCEAATGGIRLLNVSGNLRASTAIGSIIAQLMAGHYAGESFLTTGSGDITVIIPSNLGVKIRAENEMSGGARRIVSDFPGIRTQVAGGRVIAEGDVNGGGPLIRISGTGGTIFIKRQ